MEICLTLYRLQQDGIGLLQVREILLAVYTQISFSRLTQESQQLDM